MERTYYRNGKRHGDYIAYYDDGKVKKVKAYYKYGKRHGTYITYYDNGKVRKKISYINGVRQITKKTLSTKKKKKKK